MQPLALNLPQAWLIFLLLLLNGCSEGLSPELSTPQPADNKTIHLLEQDAIVNCMAEEGFKYQPTEYIDYGFKFGLDLAFVWADTAGYIGVFDGVVVKSSPTSSRPDNNMNQSETIAFSEALNGTWIHAADGHSHNEDEDYEEHDHGLESKMSGGCRQQAWYTISDLIDPSDLDFRSPTFQDKLHEYFERLSATPEYIEFIQPWATCMKEKGIEVTPDLSTHFTNRRGFYATKTIEIFDDLNLSIAPVTNPKSFKQALNDSDQLQQLFDAELSEAVADKDCRSKYWESLRPIAKDLSIDIFGIDAIQS